MARGAAVNLAGSMGAMALTFLFTFVITHLVSVHGVGLLAIGTTVVALAVVPALLGLETGTVRFVALGAAVDDERAASGRLQVAIGLVAVTSVSLTATLWLASPWLSEHYFHKPDAAALIRISALSLPGLALGRVLVAGVQGFGVMRYSAWLGVLRAIVNLAVALPLLAVGLGARGLAWAAALTATAIAAVAFAQLRRVDPGVLIPARSHWAVGKMLRFSLPQTLTATLFFTIVWTDTIVLSRFRSAAEVGIYAIVGRLLNPATLVSTAVGQMFGPRVAAEDARGDRAVLETMLQRVTYWNTVVSAPFFTMLCVLPVPLLALFGGRYRAGATALVILSAGQLVNTAAGPLGQVINLSGRPYVNMLNNTLVGAVNIAVALVLIPRYGLTGASIATASALTFVNAIKLVEVRVIFGMYPFRADTLRTLVAAGLAGALVLPLDHLVHWPDSLIESLLLATLLFTAYIGMLFALGIGDEDRELLAAGGARIARLAQGLPARNIARVRAAAVTLSEETVSLFEVDSSKSMIGPLESLRATIYEVRTRFDRTGVRVAPVEPDEDRPTAVAGRLADDQARTTSE
jgi:O-antigen/teichoic acid export membrane protein